MKTKRILFVAALLTIFGVCFTIMNRHYDELARYQYVTSENREIILQHMNAEDINYMVNQQLKPEQFLPFIDSAGFQIENTMWYNKAKEIQDGESSEIVSFVNDFRTRLEYSSLESVLKSYSYTTLRTFYEEDNDYVKNASIVLNPAAMLVLIEDQETLFSYVPKDLVSVNDIPHVSLVNGQSDILVKSEVIAPLNELCTNISSVNGKTCGNLILTAGFISYEDQIPLYESMMLKYGKDEFQNYWDYPGQNEFQLGYSVRFQLVGQEESKVDTPVAKMNEEEEALDDSEKIITWLEENAYKYGFSVRYPKGKEAITGKLYQPLTLRYVGVDVAKTLFEQKQAFDEYKVPVE